MIIDNIIFELCDIEEKTVFAILAALQAYERNAFEKHTAFYRVRSNDIQLELNMHIVRRQEYAKYDFIFRKCLSHLRSIEATSVPALGAVGEGLTSFVSLPIDVAKAIATKSSKHLAQAFGIMVGSEMSCIPDVEGLAPLQYDSTNMVLISKPVTPTHCIEHTAMFANLNYNMDLEERAARCFEDAAYMGEISFESYLMCALKKPVFEISSGEDVYLLSKWGVSNYFHSSSIDDEALKKGVELCLNRLAQGK